MTLEDNICMIFAYDEKYDELEDNDIRKHRVDVASNIIRQWFKDEIGKEFEKIPSDDAIERVGMKGIEIREWVSLVGNLAIFMLMMLFLAYIFADVAYSIKDSLEIIAHNTHCSDIVE